MKSKYNNKICIRDGYRFHSIKEGDFYLYLKDKQRKGEILYFLMQVPIKLTPSTKYVADFLVFNSDGTHDFIDVKGFVTQGAKLKLKQVQDIYGIKVKLV